MEWLEIILTPLIIPMQWLLSFYSQSVGSIGSAVLVLSVTFSVLLYPLQKWGQKIEQQISAKTQLVKAEIKQIDPTLKGEKRFYATQEIYQKNDFHPAQNILSGMSFIVQLPVLISAFILLTHYSPLDGAAFGFISDLSRPDSLGGNINSLGISINLLPVFMLLTGIIHAFFYYAADPASKNRYIVISVLLFFLIYPLPAALVMYWITSNLAGILIGLVAKR